MTEMNFETARHNMIEQQIRPWNVIDPIALDTLEAVPRENYVADNMKYSAFSDVELPIGHNQFMLFPKIEAKILQSVQIKPYENVLEIGTGSGYMTALLAHLAAKVSTVEIYDDLSQQAQKKLSSEGFDNIRFISGSSEASEQAITHHGPFDVIVLTGSVPQLSDTYKHSLRNGGRLFAVIGTSPLMEATLITRVSDTQFACEVLFETEIPRLENMTADDNFKL
ncbi:MAG: protein-L-isoaspartate O-methyltransferase [Gammaproteobacteria bacterium]|nr:protein-L-isoaspartate O-methyltransferase [Gammaproteobacteria bacterium]